MAFNKKTWRDRISEYITRRTLTKEDGTSEVVTVERNEGEISQEGDAFSAENMNDLEERLQDATNDIIVPAQGTTTFNSDGSITETLVGATSRTIFNDDGSITNSLTYDDGTVVSRTTVFNADGSITVS